LYQKRHMPFCPPEKGAEIRREGENIAGKRMEWIVFAMMNDMKVAVIRCKDLVPIHKWHFSPIFRLRYGYGVTSPPNSRRAGCVRLRF